MSQYQMMPGATTIGIICKDGVILASDRRLSYGSFIMSKATKKVFKITNNIGAACAGLVGDMQILMREAAIYTTLYSYERERNASVKTAAKMIGNILFQRKFLPYITQTIIGGVDEEGPSLYVLDLLGSVIKDKFASVGTGAEIAAGVLESEHKDNISIEEGREVVSRALKAALARDAASGDGVDLLTVTKDGIKEQLLDWND